MNQNNSIVQTSRKRKMVPDLYTILYFMLIFSEKTFSVAHNTLKDAIQDLRGNLFRAHIYRVKSKKKKTSWWILLITYKFFGRVWYMQLGLRKITLSNFNLLLAVQSFDELFQTFLNVSHMFWNLKEKRNQNYNKVGVNHYYHNRGGKIK